MVVHPQRGRGTPLEISGKHRNGAAENSESGKLRSLEASE
ncbi:hypothetical protein HMPREF9004_0749 [Schaalia cardiffensis F0333]|uniref:Uncharacterized protein n=1 Tax=Schaalia cardiffensis F0333 TaxID=888050 RepID=N6X4Z8_9ACTO|nr:hypothetical protein HMPREF9004_0749 [Schaalia cardiffensis F0333]